MTLGSGKLTIDVLSAECTFGDKRISTLSIAKQLCAWFAEELQRLAMDKSEIKRALLAVAVKVTREPWDDSLVDGQFFENGKHVRTDTMCRGVFKGNFSLVVDDKEYNMDYHDTKTWPAGWKAG